MRNINDIGLAVDNPNFSVVVPSHCNAKCEFCFWENKCDLSEEEYDNKLRQVLNTLPDQFEQCSITGGEPTMSGHLVTILENVRKRFKKVVMTSNGFNIHEGHLELIDHLNISRHKIYDDENQAVFKTKSVPTVEKLEKICETANEMGVDVTLNCVLPPDFDDLQFIEDYVQFAKGIGANAVCFRKEHSDLSLLPVEAQITSKVYYEHSCGVCLTREQFIKGMKVTWRYSVLEPSVEMSQVYELILQQNGELTMDWEGNTEIDLVNHQRITSRILRAQVRSAVSGCGGRHNGYSPEPGYPEPEPRRVVSGCGGSRSGC